MRSSSLRLALFSAAIFFAGINLGFAETQPAQTAGPRIRSIGTILITVANMDRSVEFYSRVLTFEKTSDTELTGERVEQLFGVFGTHVRIVRMTLGSESIELVQFLAPRGRSMPRPCHKCIEVRRPLGFERRGCLEVVLTRFGFHATSDREQRN
jgi:hypothetical protein